MKTKLIILIGILITACTQKSEITPRQETKTVRILPLPINFTGDSISDNKYFAVPQNTRDSVFRNKNLFPKPIRIARLPQRDNIQVVLICNQTETPEPLFIQSYTLDETNQIIDHLTLYSIEKTTESPSTIKQTFEITNNYRFKVSKHLNTLLIEQLYYRINEKGFFEEIRDGFTPAIAYESIDNIHYTVESFVWDYNEAGGLYKKDNTISHYKINPDGTINEITNQQK